MREFAIFARKRSIKAGPEGERRIFLVEENANLLFGRRARGNSRF